VRGLVALVARLQHDPHHIANSRAPGGRLFSD
jgi:hypothetical protein